MERNKGKIITVTSTKGGVGKTITTLNLAGVFSNLKKKVLVIKKKQIDIQVEML